MKHDKRIFVLYILPIFIWMGVIFYLSSGVSLKDAILHPAYYKEAIRLAKEHKMPPVNPEFTVFDDLLNNFAHICVFSILSILIYRYYGLIFVSILYASLYGLFDEFHQMFVPLRSASLEDIIFDIIGAFLGVLIVYYLNKKGKIHFVFPYQKLKKLKRL